MAARGAGVAAAILVAALAWNAATLWPWLARADTDFDALHLYFPLAKELSLQGFAFFAQERSLQAPPFAYAWPALVGAELARMKLVNLALSGLALLMVFRLGDLLHSRAAGLAAAAIFASSPLLRPYLATAVTEPPFVFLCVAWAWMLAEWLSGGRPAFAAGAGIAFALATLTRGSLFYLAPALVALFGVLAWRARDDGRRAAWGVALAHGLALAIVGIFILRGVAFFGFPFFATGAGNALYLGVSPLTGGYDSNYLGLVYDVGAIVQEPSHLTLAAERLLKGVATMVMAEQPPLQLGESFARKAMAFVFVTNAEEQVQVLRAWRIALVALALVGVAAIRLPAMRLVVAATLLYQVAVHVPVLYTHRYSVGALDPWLCVAAGVGLASLWGRWRAASLVGGLAIAAIAVGAWLASGPLPEPDAYRAPRLTVWQGEPRRVALHAGTPVEVEVRDAPRFHPWNNHVLVIDAAVQGAGAESCGPLRVSYRRTGEGAFSPEVARRTLLRNAVVRHQWGGVPLGLHAEGTLRLAIDCPVGTELEIAKLAVVQPMGSLEARERYLQEAPRFPYER